jgi:hypothetical protein
MERHPSKVRRAMLGGVQLGPIPFARAMALVAGALSPLVRIRAVRRRMAPPLGVTAPTTYDRDDDSANREPRPLRRVLALGSDFGGDLDLSGITASVLMVAGGTEHRVILPSLDAFACRVPDCVARTVPGLGHAWCNDAPSLFARTVSPWLDGAKLPRDPIVRSDLARRHG